MNLWTTCFCAVMVTFNDFSFLTCADEVAKVWVDERHFYFLSSVDVVYGTCSMVRTSTPYVDHTNIHVGGCALMVDPAF